MCLKCVRKEGGRGGLDRVVRSNYEMGMIDGIFGSKSPKPDFSIFFISQKETFPMVLVDSGSEVDFFLGKKTALILSGINPCHEIHR